MPRKKPFFSAAVVWMLLFAFMPAVAVSCGTAGVDNKYDEIISLTDENNGHFKIIWGFQQDRIKENSAAARDRVITKSLNERFNVELETLAPAGSSEDFPDIFNGTHLWGFDPEAAAKAGAIRPVPWDFVERYAPRYWATLNRGAWFQDYLNDPELETFRYALPAFKFKEESYDALSVYRLDWLEKTGIKPKGLYNQGRICDREKFLTFFKKDFRKPYLKFPIVRGLCSASRDAWASSTQSVRPA